MKTYIENLFIALAILVLNSQLSSAFAQGTAFTYQGRLNDGGQPANGVYDISFQLFDAPLGGNAIPVIAVEAGIMASNGLFTATPDFGAGVFSGTNYWMEISVRHHNIGACIRLGPRQPLTPTPYAVFAEGANAAGLSGTIAPANIANGSITGNLLAPGAVSQLGTPNGAIANAVSVDDNGFVGVGTNNTGAALQVGGGTIYFNAAGITFADALTNNSPGLTNFSYPINIFIDGTRA